MEIVQTGTSTWRWCMVMFGARFAVFVRRARVLPSPCHATRNLSFLRVLPAPSSCCFISLCTGPQTHAYGIILQYFIFYDWIYCWFYYQSIFFNVPVVHPPSSRSVEVTCSNFIDTLRDLRRATNLAITLFGLRPRMNRISKF